MFTQTFAKTKLAHRHHTRYSRSPRSSRPSSAHSAAPICPFSQTTPPRSIPPCQSSSMTHKWPDPSPESPPRSVANPRNREQPFRGTVSYRKRDRCWCGPWRRADRGGKKARRRIYRRDDWLYVNKQHVSNPINQSINLCLNKWNQSINQSMPQSIQFNQSINRCLNKSNQIQSINQSINVLANEINQSINRCLNRSNQPKNRINQSINQSMPQ